MEKNGEGRKHEKDNRNKEIKKGGIKKIKYVFSVTAHSTSPHDCLHVCCVSDISIFKICYKTRVKF
jgi:hypothetical protein